MNSAVLYAGTNQGVYQSNNTGSTWTRIGLAGQTIYALLSPAFSPGMLVAGTSAGPQISTNGGGTWSLKNQGIVKTDIWCMLAGATSNRSVYLGTSYNGTYRFFPTPQAPW